jgi:hypothetical protein
MIRTLQEGTMLIRSAAAPFQKLHVSCPVSSALGSARLWAPDPTFMMHINIFVLGDSERALQPAATVEMMSPLQGPAL